MDLGIDHVWSVAAIVGVMEFSSFDTPAITAVSSGSVVIAGPAVVSTMYPPCASHHYHNCFPPVDIVVAVILAVPICAPSPWVILTAIAVSYIAVAYPIPCIILLPWEGGDVDGHQLAKERGKMSQP